MEIKEAICRITVITILFIALVVNKHSAAFLAGGREKSNQATKICNVYKFTKMPHKNVLRVSNLIMLQMERLRHLRNWTLLHTIWV